MTKAKKKPSVWLRKAPFFKGKTIQFLWNPSVNVRPYTFFWNERDQLRFITRVSCVRKNGERDTVTLDLPSGSAKMLFHYMREDCFDPWRYPIALKVELFESNGYPAIQIKDADWVKCVRNAEQVDMQDEADLAEIACAAVDRFGGEAFDLLDEMDAVLTDSEIEQPREYAELGVVTSVNGVEGIVRQAGLPDDHWNNAATSEDIPWHDPHEDDKFTERMLTEPHECELDDDEVAEQIERQQIDENLQRRIDEAAAVKPMDIVLQQRAEAQQLLQEAMQHIELAMRRLDEER